MVKCSECKTNEADGVHFRLNVTKGTQEPLCFDCAEKEIRKELEGI